MFNLKKFAMLVLVLLMSFFVVACDSKDGEKTSVKKEETQEVKSKSSGICYKVKGGKNDLYLIGTIHVGNEEMYPLSDSIEEVVKNADVLALELDLDEVSEDEQFELTSKYAFYTDGTLLSDFLDDREMSKLELIFAPIGYNRMIIDICKPWMILTSFSDALLNGTDYKAENGVEEYLKKIYKGDEIIGLETFESQLKALASISDEDGIKAIKETLKDDDWIKEEKDGLADMVNTWIKGDADAIGKERNESYGEDLTQAEIDYNYAIMDEREAKMVEKIENFLESDDGKTYVVAVGTLHVVGEGSLSDLLKEKKYTLEQMK